VDFALVLKVHLPAIAPSLEPCRGW
jgi:hypothetical protein